MPQISAHKDVLLLRSKVFFSLPVGCVFTSIINYTYVYNFPPNKENIRVHKNPLFDYTCGCFDVTGSIIIHSDKHEACITI